MDYMLISGRDTHGSSKFPAEIYQPLPQSTGARPAFSVFLNSFSASQFHGFCFAGIKTQKSTQTQISASLNKHHLYTEQKRRSLRSTSCNKSWMASYIIDGGNPHLQVEDLLLAVGSCPVRSSSLKLYKNV